MMKKTIITLLLAASFSFSVKAQVTIGENDMPNKQAVLDLRSGENHNLGLLFPRVQLTALNNPLPFSNSGENLLANGMTVYHTGGNNLVEGIYYWIGDRWEIAGKTWFYMPSIPFDVENPGDGVEREVNLYTEYAKQFNITTPIKNPSAPVLIYDVLENTDFHYYVIGYDNTVFEISGISNTGVLKYKVIAEATDSSYINIVFVKK